MNLLLQLWGGAFYLLSKIFLSSSEGSNQSKNLRIFGWISFLIGVPAWIVILVLNHDWIASGVEFGAIPAMILGLTISIKKLSKTPQLLIRGAEICAYTVLTIGIIYSLYDFGGITSLSQIYEIGVMMGFLIGTSLLAKKNPDGWVFYMIMNACMGALMIISDNMILAFQQGISMVFAVRGYMLSKGFQPSVYLQKTPTFIGANLIVLLILYQLAP